MSNCFNHKPIRNLKFLEFFTVETSLLIVSIFTVLWFLLLDPFPRIPHVAVSLSSLPSPFLSDWFSSVHSLSRVDLCDPMNHSMPSLPVRHQLPEFTQTHVHQIGRWCHPAISSSVVPFSSYPQSLPASESFPVSQLFTWGDQSTGVSALASFLPKKSQGWSPLQWTGWISLQTKGLSRVFSNTIVQQHQYFGAQLSSQSFSHPYMTTGKTIALTRQTFVDKVMSLLFNMLSRFHL